MRLDISFLPALAAAFLLVFARIGTMVMLLPGLGELSVPVRVRLTVALLLAAVLLPLHRSAFVLALKAFGPVGVMLVEEIVIGAVLGLTARLTISALQVAGSVVAQQLGLGFVTDLHHLVIAALNEMDAPLCLARGVDAMALTIREIAAQHDIPIVENPPLAA